MKTLALLLIPSLVFAGPLDQGAQRSSPYSPDQLTALYEKNAIAAGAQLAGKVIILSGVIDQIEKDAIFFAPLRRYTYTDIRCEIDPASAALFAKARVGGRMVITGTVQEMKYSQITLTGCKPAKP